MTDYCVPVNYAMLAFVGLSPATSCLTCHLQCSVLPAEQGYNRGYNSYDRTKDSARETKEDAKDTLANARDSVKDSYYDTKRSAKNSYYETKHDVQDRYSYPFRLFSH